MNKASTNLVSDVRGWWITIALLAIGFLFWTYASLLQATSARWQDTSGYLAHALYIAEHGGFWGYLRESFAGTFPVTERHPLYLLMLAPFASRTAEFFQTAKLIDLATGFAALLTLVWMVNRRYGKAPALIAGLIYALSSSLVIASSQVNNETQFVLCSLWVWWLLTNTREANTTSDGLSVPFALSPSKGMLVRRWFDKLTTNGENTGEKSAARPPGGTSRWAWAGVWLGLAWLAKSPAILMAVAIVVAGVWHEGLKLIRSRRLWVLLATATLVSSPMWVRNVLGFGTPFYEGINSSIMWIDKWTDIGGETSTIYYDQYGVTTIENDGLPTAMDYWRSHSIGEMAARLGGGFLNELQVVIPSALGPSLQLPRYRLIGMGIFVLALAGWWLRRKSWDACFTFFWSAAFLAFFSWNRMFPEIRYLAPLIPVWIAFASYAAWQLCLRVLKPELALRSVLAAGCLAILGVLGWTVANGAYRVPQPVMEASPSYLRFVEWLNRTLEPGDRIMIGETREFHGLIWMVERPVQVLLMSNSESLDEFLRYLRERKVRYLLIHPEYLTGANRNLAAALEPFLAVTAEGAIVQKQALPGWQPVYTDEGSSPHFIVYQPE